jgi:hypothetical protein
MNELQIRTALSSAIGTIDYVHAALSRAEQGTDRATVERARGQLKTLSADLLMLRARLLTARDGCPIKD